ncbi:MAG: hypothetical protein KGI26_04540 [Thaumarchaeota archaeon]|nr:hypothetical protein [Nitrososphaerota archaeon]
MNKNLVIFGAFLIVLGAGVGYYLISLFGLLILIPALIAPSRPISRLPTSAKEEPRRIAPKPQPMPAQVQTPASQPAMAAPISQPGPYSSYSPALFPNSMFPSLSLSAAVQLQPASAAPAKAAERDELIETGALLALLKLFVG